MGNALGCAGLGERLAAAARDGDGAEVRRLLEANPGLARCAAFGSLNSPLHLAAAKGHREVRACVIYRLPGLHVIRQFFFACSFVLFK
jgi:E3 ubiquitin-protein ligase XBAT32/33